MSRHEHAGRRESAPERIGRYDVVTTLGEGGLATVYLGRQRGPGGYEREVALKVLHGHLRDDEELTLSLVAEAKLLSRIRHPNVVAVLDVGEDESGVFVAMDHVAGASLAELMKAASKREQRVIPRAIAARMMVDALAGLHAAHELVDETGSTLNLVHRDVSPQNILIGTDGIARLIDFGIARFERRELKTRTGLIKGKASYMAPEQARGRDLDRRCDVWAAGVVAWELFAGKRLFKTEDEMTTLFEVVTGEVPQLGEVVEVPRPLEEAVSGALRRDLADRTPTAEALARAIEAAVTPAPTPQVAAYVMEAVGDSVRAEEARIASAVRTMTRGERGTTHALEGATPQARPVVSKRAPWMPLAAVAAILLASVMIYGRSAERDEPAPAQSAAPAPVPTSRIVRVVANAPMASLTVDGKPVALPMPADRIEISLPAHATGVALDARSEDGRRVRHVATAIADELRLVFDAEPVASAAPAPSVPAPRLPAPVRPKPKPSEPPVGPSPYGNP
jgi:eukaryotic-like serine/threonine-protein kinase